MQSIEYNDYPPYCGDVSTFSLCTYNALSFSLTVAENNPKFWVGEKSQVLSSSGRYRFLVSELHPSLPSTTLVGRKLCFRICLFVCLFARLPNLCNIFMNAYPIYKDQYMELKSSNVSVKVTIIENTFKERLKQSTRNS